MCHFIPPPPAGFSARGLLDLERAYLEAGHGPTPGAWSEPGRPIGDAALSDRRPALQPGQRRVDFRDGEMSDLPDLTRGAPDLFLWRDLEGHLDPMTRCMGQPHQRDRAVRALGRAFRDQKRRAGRGAQHLGLAHRGRFGQEGDVA
jgi:hypothetical protein